MQIIENTRSLQSQSLSALHTFLQNSDETYLFFDIETTGLSPDVSSLYLIGALWFDTEDDSIIHTKQWFADDYTSEKEILLSFSEFLSGFTTLVHYNGSGFDLPYIEKKCHALTLASPFQAIKSLDIFREIRKRKSFFDVKNLKLFTVEKLTGFMRTDILTGKDCIHVYSDFMQKKYLKDPAMDTNFQKLLLHNLEDIIGTCLSAQLLFYWCKGIFQSSHESNEIVCADFVIPGTFPFPVIWNVPDSCFTITFDHHRIQLRIPLVKGTLFHFFKDYKNYFYLPNEDTAIHKSVGIYIDKACREPAKASTCYIKKEGLFLPVPAGFTRENDVFFQTGYKSRQNYLLWDDETKRDPSLIEDILSFLLD